MEELVQILIPISICVVLPVLIVWIVSRQVTNRDNKNAEIIIKAIENNSSIDADKLVEAMGKRQKSPEQMLQARLLRGCIYTLIGIASAIMTPIMAYNNADADLQTLFLVISGLSLAIGIAYLIVYFMTRKSAK